MSNLQIDQVDIRSILNSLGISYSEKGKNVSENWIGVPCPFCGDVTNHFGINLVSKRCSCFRCGKKTNIIVYLSEILYSKQKAYKIVEEAIPRELRSFISEKINSNVQKVKLPIGAGFIINEQTRLFLKSRKYDAFKLCKKYKLRLCREDAQYEWRNRIIVPIHRFGKLVTFTSIDVTGKEEIKYKHLSEEKSIIHCKQLLYGEEFNKDKRKVIVVEGIFDKFRMGEGSVCTFGTKVTKEQKLLLSRYKEVKICFDGDKPGREAAQQLADDLSGFTSVSIIDLPDDIDPDKLNKQKIEFIKKI